jgi:class 3 adenylate cyclase
MNAPLPSLSVLAVGICGNARLHEKLESSEASRAVDRCLKRIGRSVEASGGRAVRNGGNEMIAAFDTAEAAIHAVVDMQQRIATLPPISGVKMAIRAGISHAQAAQPSEEALAREAARLAGLAKPGKILACGRIGKALPDALRARLADTGQTQADEAGRDEPVVEIMLEAPAARADAPAEDGATGETRATPPANAWLRLRYGENTIVFEEYRPIVDMGRDGTCDVIIRDVRASRHHATIRRRNGLVVLVDSSRNGTFVTLDGDSEKLVKGSEYILRGNGRIAFASPSSAPNADCAEFECL